MSEMHDKSKIERIIQENESRLKSFIRNKVYSDEDAEDILQDVFYQLVKNMQDEPDSIERISGWLFRVAKNMIINKGKKKKEERWPTTNEDNEALAEFSEILFNDDNPGPDMVYMRAMVWDELDSALTELPEKQRIAFELTALDGLPVREVAESLGISQNTLLSRKHYAVKFLRSRLAGLYRDLLEF